MMVQDSKKRTNSDKKALNKAKTNLARKKRFSLASVSKPATQQIQDLEWRIKFTQMKLNLWRDLENGQWKHLKDLHEQAKFELKQLKAA